jgi:8-oxo-dGTP diphosphatase
MNGRFQLVPAAYVILRRADEILLQLRRGTGYMDEHWACAAAGHVERGESVHEAAAREMREELGVEVLTADLTPLTSMHRTGATGLAIDERVDWFFECTRWEGTPRIVEPNKAADLRWFALDAPPDPVVPHELFVLDQILAGSLPPVLTYGF